MELILKDLDTVAKSITKTEKQLRDQVMKEKHQFLLKLSEHLDSGKLANNFVHSNNSLYLNDLHLLTSKKMLYVANTYFFFF
jgi:ribosome-binding ATPase YchF (GTP1/OBG family)